MHTSESPPLAPFSWRALRTAVWLGWLIESNWARPGVFMVYTVIKPLAVAGILVAMYVAIGRGGFDSPAFVYMYVGNALYMFVGAVMSGMGWAVVQDREHYRMLKSMYVAPMDFRLYLVGRGTARFAIAAISVLLTLVAGVLLFALPIGLDGAGAPRLVGVLVMGLTSVLFMGLAAAGIMLLSGQNSWGMGELLAGALYLFSGAIFPLDVIPAALRPIGLALPVTYWLELIRRSLAPTTAGVSSLFGTWSDGSLVTALGALTLVFAALSLAGFYWCERRARDRGLIDTTSNY